MLPARVAQVISLYHHPKPPISSGGEVVVASKPIPDSTSSSVVDLENAASPRASPDSVKNSNIQPLSTLRLWLAHIGAALTLFLATTDATIVSTSLPTIVSDLGATQSQYTWVGVAYLLTQTACQPLYGRISDLVGRKNLLYTSMMIFATGSLLCGAAKNITWLIIARGFAGVGGGGIVSSVWVITSEIVEVRNRAKWSQALSITWSCSAIAGPLLGGVFSTGSTTLSWRWGFYLNLPVCFAGYVVLLVSLRHVDLDRAKDASWKTFVRKFDFAGLVLFMGGSSGIVVGFSFATELGWTAPSTLLLIIVGLVVLFCGGIYEVRTKRDALFPVTVFKDSTAIIILAVTFLHNFAFNAGTFYLALYYQAVNGSTPLEAGINLLPYSLGASLVSFPAAWFIGFWQRKSHDMTGQKWVICIGLVISTLGFGLLNLLHERSPSILRIVFPLISGLGLGMLFHAPYQVFTKALEPHELATGTSAFFLVRFTGATVGLAVAGAVFYGRLSHNLPTEFQTLSSQSSINWKSLSSIQPTELRWEVLHAVSASIQTIWMVCAPCLGLALFITLFLRRLPIDDPLDRTLSQEKLANAQPPLPEPLT